MPRPLWEEAFDEDPHAPRETAFPGFGGGQIRAKARFPVREEQRAERAGEHPMMETYAELRGAGLCFEEIAEANSEAMLNWKLGPLFDLEASRPR